MISKVETFWFNDSSFDKLYPLKVFISTILGVAILMSLLFFIGGENDDGGYVHFATLVFTYGIAYSLPTFVIYYLAFIYFTKQNLSLKRIKLYLILTTIILLPFPFYFMGHEYEGWNFFILPLFGLLIAIIMTFIFPLKRARV